MPAEPAVSKKTGSNKIRQAAVVLKRLWVKCIERQEMTRVSLIVFVLLLQVDRQEVEAWLECLLMLKDRTLTR